MATDKNFVIKNGLTVGTTEVIDSSGNLVNSSGSISGTTITGSDRGTFEDLVLTGDADDDLTFTVSSGDWFIKNSQQGNGVLIYDGTAGVQLVYNNQSRLEVLTGGLNVVNGTLSIAGTEFADASRNITVGTISSGTITSSGNIDVNSDSGQLQFGADNDMQMFHNGANGEINNATGDFTIDSAGDITLDADGRQIFLKDGGTSVGTISLTDQNFKFISDANDKDMIFAGTDGGSEITALTLDMSEGGNATFAGTIGSDKITVTHSGGVPLDLHGSTTGISYISLANTATAATNNGSGIEFRANSSTQERQVGYITARFTNTTDASRESQMTFYTSAAGSQAAPLYLQGENATFANDVTVSGNLYVTGTSTAVNVEDLNVEQGEITLNYGTGDTSASANGSGIRIQDAVNSTTDATILWNTTSDEFDFSHGIDVTGDISAALGTFTQSVGSFPLVTSTPYDFTAKFESTDAGGYIVLEDSDSTNNANYIGVAGNDFKIYTAGALGLTINSSQNATFEGDVKIGSGGVASLGEAGLCINVTNKPQLLLDGGTDAYPDIVVPTGETLQIAHWDVSANSSSMDLSIETDGDVTIERGAINMGSNEVISSSRAISATDITANNLTLLESFGHTTFELGSRSADPLPAATGSYDFKPGMRVIASDGTGGSGVDADDDIIFAWNDDDHTSSSEGYLASTETYATASFSKTFSITSASGARFFAKVKLNDAESGNDPRIAVNGGTEYKLEYFDAPNAAAEAVNDTDSWHVIDITDDVVTGTNTFKAWLAAGQKTYIIAIYIFKSTGIMLPNEPYESVAYSHKGFGVGDTRIVSEDRNLINIGTINSGAITSSAITSTGTITSGGIFTMPGGGDAIAFVGTGTDTSPRNFAYENGGHHYVTNRHTDGDLVLMSNSGSGGAEITRMTLKAGGGTQDIDITNANLDLNSNNITGVGALSATTGVFSSDVNIDGELRLDSRYDSANGDNVLAFKDSDGNYSIRHNVNDGNGNYSISLGYSGAGNGQYAVTGDGVSKILFGGHGADGYLSLNAATTGTAATNISFSMGLLVDHDSVRVGASADGTGLQDGAGTKVFDASANAFATSYSVGSSTVIDSSSNLTNIGTISSGNITINTSNAGTQLTIQSPVPDIEFIDSNATTRKAKISAENGNLAFEADPNTSEANTTMTFKMDGTNALAFSTSKDATFAQDVISNGLTIGNWTIGSNTGQGRIGKASDRPTGAITNQIGTSSGYWEIVDYAWSTVVAQCNNSGDLTAYRDFNTATGGYEVNSTTVIDSSRNLTNIAKITGNSSSGGTTTFNVGRGDVYFENNSNSNANGAGITLRTSSNPTTGSIFDVRSSGQACRFFVGQDITTAGDNPFYVGDVSTGGESTASNYEILLDTNGDITAEGNITAYGSVSDIRQKENIEQIDKPIERLEKIKGITFNYKKKSEDERLMGVIAQDLLEDDILKLAVYEQEDFKAADDDPLKHTYGVRYEHLTAILIEAVKEQQKQIEELKEEVSSLRLKN